MKKLKEVMPIDRAKMKLRITTDDNAAPLKEALGELGVVSFESGGSAGAGSGGGEVVDFLVDPGMYRDVEEAVRTVAGWVHVWGRTEYVSRAAVGTGEARGEVSRETFDDGCFSSRSAAVLRTNKSLALFRCSPVFCFLPYHGFIRNLQFPPSHKALALLLCAFISWLPLA